jgi:hypothetical protein
MGFTKENVKDSIFWSHISFCAVYGTKLPDSIQELKIKGSKYIKKGILGIKLKNMNFKCNHMAYGQFWTMSQMA